MSTDERERVAERGGDWAAVARERARRGDRAGLVAALARQARAEVARDWRVEARVAIRVRELLCDLVPCPVGRWGTTARGSMLPRLPRLTESEERMVRSLARSA